MYYVILSNNSHRRSWHGIKGESKSAFSPLRFSASRGFHQFNMSSSKSQNPCACVVSDEISQCPLNTSDTDSSSETEKVVARTDRKRKMLTVSTPEELDKKKTKYEEGESSKDSDMQVLSVKEGRVEREVQIIRVETRVQKSRRIIKNPTTGENVTPDVIDLTRDIRIVQVQGSAHDSYKRGGRFVEFIDLTKDSASSSKGKILKIQIVCIVVTVENKFRDKLPDLI